jgi:hypothetical protein
MELVMIARKSLLALALSWHDICPGMASAPAQAAHPAAKISAASGKLDATPRTVIITAFEPEWVALEGAVKGPKAYHINGLTILTGTMAGPGGAACGLAGIGRVDGQCGHEHAIGDRPFQRQTHRLFRHCGRD